MMDNQFLRSESSPEGQAKYQNNILPTTCWSASSNISRSNGRGIKWNNNLHNTLCWSPSHCTLSLQACTCGTRCSRCAKVPSWSSDKSEEITYVIDSTGHPKTAPCVSRPVVVGWGISDMLKCCVTNHAQPPVMWHPTTVHGPLILVYSHLVYSCFSP